MSGWADRDKRERRGMRRSREIFSIPFFILVSVGMVLPIGWAKDPPTDQRDPFVPLITPEGKRLNFVEEQHVDTGLEKLSRVTFQGIVMDESKGSYAILNGHVVKEQEEIDGIKVIKIEPNIVTIVVEGKQYQIVLHPLTEEAPTGP